MKDFALQCAGDDTGDNISQKNAYYCELTGLYWAWKNLSCDIIGLCHYRRYFAEKIFRGIYRALDINDFVHALQEADVLTPQKEEFEETVYKQYADNHYEKDIQSMQEILRSQDPEGAKAFDEIMMQKTLYPYNMFCMKKDRFDAYCSWLFPLLLEFEKGIDFEKRDTYQKRVCGFMSERLFNVWIRKEHLKVKEQPVWFLGRKNRRLITWILKKCNDFHWLEKG